MKQVNILQIEDSWYNLLKKYFDSSIFLETIKLLKEEQYKFNIYPETDNILNAYNLCLLDKVKVIILGQDPYIHKGEAHGLAFSVKDETKFPPSLYNIFQELDSDLKTEIPESGNLTRWAEQGVLLLNSTLTVRENQSLSHAKIGWKVLTDYTISQLSYNKENLIFLLWGKHAQEKEALIDKTKGHIILKASHPSPYSARFGFFGCKHFSKTNQILESQDKSKINW